MKNRFLAAVKISNSFQSSATFPRILDGALLHSVGTTEEHLLCGHCLIGAQLSAVESNNDKALVRNVCELAHQDSPAIFCTMLLLVPTLSFGFVL